MFDLSTPEDIKAAVALLADIDGNPHHPANNARHPEHAASVAAYRQLDQWCIDQRRLYAKQAATWATIDQAVCLGVLLGGKGSS